MIVFITYHTTRLLLQFAVTSYWLYRNQILLQDDVKGVLRLQEWLTCVSVMFEMALNLWLVTYMFISNDKEDST